MANDFFSDVLSVPGNTGGNPSGSATTAANVEKVPGLNTLGVSMSRVDYAPWGTNPPHTHPRASEILFVVDGSLDVGFVTSSGKFFGRTVCKKCSSSRVDSSTFRGTTMARRPRPYWPSTASFRARRSWLMHCSLPRRWFPPTCWPGRSMSTTAWSSRA
ncbi:hypothetical protein ZWY2020_047367 [Hordeum vulgare]|nr:hypothetical protein ZWY2020_047367 [Hordeum vulgare]